MAYVCDLLKDILLKGIGFGFFRIVVNMSKNFMYFEIKELTRLILETTHFNYIVLQ